MTQHQEPAKFNAAKALTDEELKAIAPSVFGAKKSPTTSERYAFIDSRKVLKALRDEGFEPTHAKQSNDRAADGKLYAKHLVRFRHMPSQRSVARVGEVLPEVVLVNAHNRSSAYKLYGGLLRVLCLNGLIVDDGLCEAVRIGHSGDVAKKVAEGSLRVLESATRAVTAVRDWSRLTLTTAEQLEFAKRAVDLRFHEAKPEPSAVLIARRPGDDGDDLWRVFNRVQENLMRGGVAYKSRDSRGRVRNIHSRAITYIDGDVKLNRELWALGSKTFERLAA